MSRSNSSPEGEWGFSLHPTYASQFAIGFQFLPTGAKNAIVVGKLALDYVLSIVTLFLETLLRSRWGSRGLSLFQAVHVTILTLIGLLLADKLLAAFLVTATVAVWWRYVEGRRGEWRRRPYRYSYSPGEPFAWEWIGRFCVRQGVPRRFLGDEWVFRLWEPATGLAFGTLLLLLPVSRWLGIALVVCGLALLVKRHVLFGREIGLRRDRADAEAVGLGLRGAEAHDADEVYRVRLLVMASPPAITQVPEHPPERVRVVCQNCEAALWVVPNEHDRVRTCTKCGQKYRLPGNSARAED